MKKMIALISLIVSCTVYGYEEFHNFTMDDGFVFSAVVIACDSQEDTVELLTADGYTIHSSLSVFTEEDGIYLKQQEMAELFMSPTRFVIIPTHTVDQQWRVEDLSGESDEGVFSTTSISEHRHYLTLYNLGGIALENIELSYQILYEQSGAAADEASLTEWPQDSSFETEETTLSSVADGVIQIEHLGALEWKVYSTRSAVVTGSSSSRMLITVSMEAADGSILTREIELPVYNSVDSNAD
ncbi:hypothetical protein P4C99_08210 [Pontiellaceae bacterium B1224]|nr:hypothetical protein [Pontiellaceae bacterium B1224]